MEIRFIDLFAGIGGFRYGLESVRRIQMEGSKNNADTKSRKAFQCVYTNEWDKYASQIYKKHYGECDTTDITKVNAKDIPDFDLLCGGFPCQAFSIAGKRKGFKDTRGTLFFEICRILKEKRPKYLLLENVKGLLSSKTYLTFEQILDKIAQEIYTGTIWVNDFSPIKSWQIMIDNLSIYLQSIGKINGLQKNYKFWHEKNLPIMKKLKNFLTEQMPASELSVEEFIQLHNK